MTAPGIHAPAAAAHRVRLTALIAGATLCCGCHLLFPFEVPSPPTGDGAPDQASAIDAAPDSPPAPDGPQSADLPPPLDGPDRDAVTKPHVWSKTAGSTGSCWGQDVATGPAGSVYWAGSYNGTCTVGGKSLPATAGKWNGFVASFTSGGAVKWVQALVCTDDLRAVGLAVDSKGTAYVTGHFKGTASVKTTTYTAAGQDAFVAALTATGAHHWFRNYGGSKADQGTDVAVDGVDTPILVGSFAEVLGAGSSVLFAEGASDAFVLRLDPKTGAPVNGVRVGGISSEVATSVVADAAGNAYASINFWGNITKPMAVTMKGPSDLLLVQVTKQGTIPSWRHVSSASAVEGNGLALDAAGTLYVTGSIAGSTDFGGTTKLTTAVTPNLFVASYTSALKFNWSVAPAASKAARGSNVTARPSSMVHVVGYFQDDVIFGSDKLVANGSKQDVLVARYLNTGSPNWATRLGGPETDLSLGVATDATGAVYVSGTFQKTVDFGGGPKSCPGAICAYLVKLAP